MSQTVFPKIALATSNSEIERCYPVMVQLRPHLQRDSFVSRVRVQQQQGYQLAYLHGSQVVGAAGFNLSHNLAWGKYLYVADLVVDESQRSGGYGAALFNWLLEYARGADCQQIHLDSGVQRFDAHRFYLGHRMKISSHHFSLTVDV